MMNKKLFLIASILIFSFVLLSGCSNGNKISNDTYEKYFSLSGQVTDKNGEGIEGVDIHFKKIKI